MKSQDIEIRTNNVIKNIERAIKNTDAIKKAKKNPVVRIKLAGNNTSKKEPKPTFNGDIITLAEICNELNIEPTKARRTLRKHLDLKVSGKWEWDIKKHKDVIDKVKKLLK